jgi:ABC-type sugar transport system permease subunit
MKGIKRSTWRISPYLYVAPAFIFMIALIFYPMVLSLLISFNKWNGLGPMTPVGFENYRRLLFADSDFGGSMIATFIWVVMSITVLTVTSLVLALIVEFGVVKKRMIAITRTILFMPMTMSLVSVGLLWSLILNPLLGLLTKVLAILGLISQSNPPDFLGTSSTALLAVFVPVIWQWSGFGMVIFSSAMQGIPEEILEASIIDGCSRWKQIKHIILPLLRPTVAILVTVNCIGGFKAFDILYVMTAGGPANASMVATIYMFRQAFVSNSFGYSAAISVVMFLVAAFFGVVCMRLSQKTENYF